MMYATLSLNFSRKLSWKLSWCQRGFILSAVWPLLNAMVIARSKILTRRKFANSQHHNSDLKWKNSWIFDFGVETGFLPTLCYENAHRGAGTPRTRAHVSSPRSARQHVLGSAAKHKWMEKGGDKTWRKMLIKQKQNIKVDEFCRNCKSRIFCMYSFSHISYAAASVRKQDA